MAEAVILKKILEELMENAKQIRQEELEQFADKIQEGNRIFVAGARAVPGLWQWAFPTGCAPWAYRLLRG